jgi:cytochrome P450/NADPH-cytochrome P450 reductase
METIPIPGPPGLPLLGNIGDIDTKNLLGSVVSLADKYGNLYARHQFSNLIYP